MPEYEIKHELVLAEFPTHVNITQSKKHKVGFNALYSGLHYSVRKKMVEQLKEYVVEELKKAPLPQLTYPIFTEIIFYVPINYGTVRWSKEHGRLQWQVPPKNYIPNWDIKNLTMLWEKVIDDALVAANYISDDSVSFITRGRCAVEFINELKNRKIVYRLWTQK